MDIVLIDCFEKAILIEFNESGFKINDLFE